MNPLLTCRDSQTYNPDARMKTQRVVAIAPEALPSMLDHMAVLADPLRCRMVLLLERTELTVSEVCTVLQLPQSTVSRHLKTLGDNGWVSSRRDGTSRYYSVALDDMDAGARRLWPIIREQLSSTTSADQDERRLKSVLGRRRSRSAAFFSSASGRWDLLREELFGSAFHLHALVALVDPALAVGDLGCGTGQISRVLAPHVSRVTGVDGSPDMLQAARARSKGISNLDFRLGTLEALPIDDGELDVTILALVLHHVPDPARALAESVRVLKPGGKTLVIDMLPHDRAEYQQQMGHVWLGFPEKPLRKLMTTAGFSEVKIHALPVDPDAKGPALFAAIAQKSRA
jgi:ubiquinone/menaquinone biosynthesis C-methylase UbiE/DNA-binding transcriptional ArsR family regulator